MYILLALASLVVVGLVFIDAFEAMVLPRRVTRAYRPARAYYRSLWALWREVACRLFRGKRRETFLGVFGPLSMLLLFCLWAAALILAFGLLHWSLATPMDLSREEPLGPVAYLYFSGVTFFTLGFGDVAPIEPLGRFLAVAEAGIGFGFMAVIIGYLPVLSQAASQREITISLLDARAGSPPTAVEGLSRAARVGRIASIEPFLAEWERWAAQLLESHLSFPVLVYYRSQHDNQSWLAALTAVLDGCALFIAGVKHVNPYQAQLTFAMARHAMVDLALVLKVPPHEPEPPRLSPAGFLRLRERLAEAGLELEDGQAEQRFAELRAMYEPVAFGLAQRLMFTLPPILAEKRPIDNWQTSPWLGATPGIGDLPAVEGRDEHFR
ncbi:MAG TPA: potassium channel family protein [Pirellulales bacterium]|nr:potassium channel family protein [Pirellulales bacterium]